MAKSYKKILLPLDGSRLAERALDDLNAVASNNKECLVTLLRVVEPLLPAHLVDYFNIEEYRVAKERIEADAKGYLRKIAEDLIMAGMRVEIELIFSSEVAGMILDYAKEKKMDLIIMSTHGRSGVQRWIFGSVAQRILRHSAIPVLMIPATGPLAQSSQSNPAS